MLIPFGGGGGGRRPEFESKPSHFPTKWTWIRLWVQGLDQGAMEIIPALGAHGKAQ